MPNAKVIAAFYLASGIILYCAYSTLLTSREIGLSNPMHQVKRVMK